VRSRRISCFVNGFSASWPNPFPPKTQQVESKNVAKTICFLIGVPPLPLNGVSLIGTDCAYISWIAYARDRQDARCPVRATLNGKCSNHSTAETRSPSVRPCTDEGIIVVRSNSMSGIKGMLRQY